MLTPQQVLPFLTHSDSGVRYHAVHYFGDLADASPPETADHIWKAIDQFGGNVNAMGNAELDTFIRVLPEVPQDEASVARALALLKKPDNDRNLKLLLNQYFLRLPLRFVDAHRDEILAGVDAKHRKQLEHRLAMRSMTFDQLWEQLLEQETLSEEAEDGGQVDTQTAEMIGMALVPHADAAIPRAMAVLGDSSDRYWLKVWCIQLLGELRHAPAIDLMIEQMRTDDGDFIGPVATVSLSRMDPAVVVPKLIECYRAGYTTDDGDGDDGDGDDEDGVYVSSFCAEALGKMKHPLAESAAIELLENETDPALTSALCMALVEMCTTEGLDLLRSVVIEERYDALFSDAKVDLMLLAMMVDYHPPELEVWEKEIKSPGYRGGRAARSGDSALSKATAEMMLRYLDRVNSKTKPVDPQELSHANVPQQTIRREAPKIGRNDPCPCGSGKKYKKCCGK